MRKLLMLGSGSYGSTLAIRLRDLARHLRSGFDVTLMTPPADKYNNFKPDYTIYPHGYRLIQPWQLKTRLPTVNLLPYLFTSFVHLLRANADVVYMYKPTPITVLGLIPRLWGRQVILDMDDLGSEVMRLEGQSRLNVALVAASERLCMRFATKIVVTSTLLESLVRQRYPRKPVLLLPNGVEPTDYIKPAKKPVRSALYFFGGINRLNLVEDTLRAFADVQQAVPDARLTIAGGGSALGAAQKLAVELGIEKSVTFTGWLSDMHSIQQYTHYGDIGLCYQPDGRTNRAASNMKVFQYMAMRTVPVVSAVGDLPNYVADGKAGVVVPPGDAKALANALIDLLTNTERRAKLTDQAYKLAATTHSWQQRARTLSAFIEEDV